jgi:hypothetical protein
MFKKICRNRYFTFKELKLYSDNKYYIIIDLEFKNTDRFIEDMKHFDSEKEVVKMILEDDKNILFVDLYSLCKTKWAPIF